MTSKSDLWRICSRMQQTHGSEHYSFMPLSFILPDEVEIYEAFLRMRHAEQSQQQLEADLSSDSSPPIVMDVWILKPER